MNYDKLRFGNNKFDLNHIRSEFSLLMKMRFPWLILYAMKKSQWDGVTSIIYIIYIVDITDVSKLLYKIVAMHVFIKFINNKFEY